MKLLKEHGMSIEHVDKPNIRKEDLVAKVIARRGKHPGGAQRFAGALAQCRVHPGSALRQLSRVGGSFFFAAALGLIRCQMPVMPAPAASCS